VSKKFVPPILKKTNTTHTHNNFDGLTFFFGFFEQCSTTWPSLSPHADEKVKGKKKSSYAIEQV